MDRKFLIANLVMSQSVQCLLVNYKFDHVLKCAALLVDKATEREDSTYLLVWIFGRDFAHGLNLVDESNVGHYLDQCEKKLDDPRFKEMMQSIEVFFASEEEESAAEQAALEVVEPQEMTEVTDTQQEEIPQAIEPRSEQESQGELPPNQEAPEQTSLQPIVGDSGTSIVNVAVVDLAILSKYKKALVTAGVINVGQVQEIVKTTGLQSIAGIDDKGDKAIQEAIEKLG